MNARNSLNNSAQTPVRGETDSEGPLDGFSMSFLTEDTGTETMGVHSSLTLAKALLSQSLTFAITREPPTTLSGGGVDMVAGALEFERGIFKPHIN